MVGAPGWWVYRRVGAPEWWVYRRVGVPEGGCTLVVGVQCLLIPSVLTTYLHMYVDGDGGQEQQLFDPTLPTQHLVR